MVYTTTIGSSQAHQSRCCKNIHAIDTFVLERASNVHNHRCYVILIANTSWCKYHIQLTHVRGICWHALDESFYEPISRNLNVKKQVFDRAKLIDFSVPNLVNHIELVFSLKQLSF